MLTLEELEGVGGADGNREILLYVGGKELPTESGEIVEDRAPATGAPLASVHTAGARDVDVAVEAAVEAQPDWRAMGVPERARRMEALAERMTEAADSFGRIDAADTGSPIRSMRAGASKGALYLRLCAALGLEMKGETIPASGDGLHMTVPEPWGVVGAISAFNHPTLFACQKIGPALIAGNSVVLKPPEQAPLSAMALASIADDILPPGVLNVVPGGREAGTALVSHPNVPRITFTGGVPTGLLVQQMAASSGTIKQVTLELGGKNPILIFPDTDPDVAADATVKGMNFTRVQGQSCGSTSRLLVPRELHDEVVARIIDKVNKIRVGLPDSEETEMGSLISQQHQQRVLSYIDSGKQEGARLVAGGSRPDAPELAQGAYVLPTVFDDVTPEMRIAREEIFGPVLSVMTWSDVENAVALANDVPYGLTASIWTKDIDRALDTASRIEAGYIWINDVETRYPGVPFGGWKQSGLGYEHDLSREILSFTRTKSISVKVRAS